MVWWWRIYCVFQMCRHLLLGNCDREKNTKKNTQTKMPSLFYICSCTMNVYACMKSVECTVCALHCTPKTEMCLLSPNGWMSHAMVCSHIPIRSSINVRTPCASYKTCWAFNSFQCAFHTLSIAWLISISLFFDDKRELRKGERKSKSHL